MLVLQNFLRLPQIIEKLFAQTRISVEAAMNIFSDHFDNPERLEAEQLLHFHLVLNSMQKAYRAIYGPAVCEDLLILIDFTMEQALGTSRKHYIFPQDPEKDSFTKDAGSPSDKDASSSEKAGSPSEKVESPSV